MARTYNRLRETTFDLYIERDALPSIYKFGALIASWIAAIGYVLFALASSIPTESLRASHYLLAAIGGILLIVGYLGVACAALLSRSLLFSVDAALFPILTSSLVGAIITILTYGLNDALPVPRIYVVIPLIVSCSTTALSGIFLYVISREISKIKSRDERRRWHIQMAPYGDAVSLRSHERSLSGPEDEAQRRQLARLLDDRREPPSMDNLRGTYKIDLPGQGEERGRSASVPAQRSFHVSQLLPWSNSRVGTFKDARERRREEIERSGLPHSDASSYGVWYPRSRSTSREPQPHEQSSNHWGWPPATRYA